MKRNHPDNHAVLMGYGNILEKKGHFDEAVRIYNKVIELKPKLIKAYECIAMIYEYKRVNKKKSCDYANRALAIDPKSMYALFVLCRNQSTPDEKIKKLKELCEIYPKFSRAFNETGIIYGGTKKMYDEAISWYEKCTVKTPEYASCYNNIGVNYELKKM